MSRRQPPTMVLPHVDAHGYADDAWSRSLGDVRVPAPLTYDAEVRTFNATERCVDDQPRHLWDILESAEWREVETDGGEWVEEASFREVLTCVRCGLVRQREGIRRERSRGRLEVEPLRAGDLRAVQVKVEAFFDGDESTYLVVDVVDQVVGRICWSRGPRGRRYYVGALGETHPRTGDAVDVVEGATPVAVLRKLASQAAMVTS